MEFANIVLMEDIHMMVRSEEFYAFLLQKRKRVNILENKRKSNFKPVIQQLIRMNAGTSNSGLLAPPAHVPK